MVKHADRTVWALAAILAVVVLGGVSSLLLIPMPLRRVIQFVASWPRFNDDFPAIDHFDRETVATQNAHPDQAITLGGQDGDIAILSVPQDGGQVDVKLHVRPVSQRVRLSLLEGELQGSNTR